MSSKYNIDEEDLVKLEPLIADLRHEITNPVFVLEGNIELREEDSDGDLEDASEDQIETLEEFIEDTKYVKSYLDLMGTLPDEEIQSLQDYAETNHLPESMCRQVKKIASVARDVYNYQTRLLEGENGESVNFSQLLDPLESCAEEMDGIQTDFDYNDLRNEAPAVDSGMKLVFWTIGKNWAEHAYGEVDDLDVGFELDEREDNYRIHIWDTGPGLFEYYPGKDGKSVEMRYRRADQLFSSPDGAHGLGMAKNISEVYDSKIFYNEDLVNDEGFGITVELPRI